MQPSNNNRLLGLLHEHWQPKPIDPPTIDPDLKQLDGVQRAAETIRYSFLSFEYWLSPLGRLREWVRLNSKLCAILLVPAALVLPVVTWIIYQVALWASMLVGLAGNLILLPIVGLIALAAVYGAIVVLRAIFGK